MCFYSPPTHKYAPTHPSSPVSLLKLNTISHINTSTWKNTGAYFKCVTAGKNLGSFGVLSRCITLQINLTSTSAHYCVVHIVFLCVCSLDWCIIYTQSVKKHCYYTLIHKVDKCCPIFEIFSLLYCPRNFQQNSCHIFHRILDMLLRYLAKYKRLKNWRNSAAFSTLNTTTLA